MVFSDRLLAVIRPSTNLSLFLSVKKLTVSNSTIEPTDQSKHTWYKASECKMVFLVAKRQTFYQVHINRKWYCKIRCLLKRIFSRTELKLPKYANMYAWWIF